MCYLKTARGLKPPDWINKAILSFVLPFVCIRRLKLVSWGYLASIGRRYIF